MVQENKPHLVIVGAGFAGLYAASKLGKTDYRITVVDKRNFHLFQPLLYQVATGTLDASDIATPIRSVLRKNQNTTVLQSTANDIDPERKVLIHESGELSYDKLVVATGVKHQYFGNDQWNAEAPGLKTVDHALEIRRRILTALENAELETEPEKRATLMRFVVVGAGPTGVELAGTIAELCHKTVVKDFRNIDPRDCEIYLIEGAPQVLPPYPKKLGDAAQKSLEDLGVTVVKQAMVTNIERAKVTLKADDEERQIDADTILWAAGVKASKFGQALSKRTGVELDRAGKVKVNPDLSLPNHPDIFVAGDLACFEHQGDRPLPGVAPVAKQQGSYLAKRLKNELQGKDSKAFKYNDQGSMAVIAVNHAVADVYGFKFKGAIAWFLWAFIHIFYLVETDKKILVTVRWLSKYILRKRGVRLITGGPFARTREDITQ
ncbi:MAG: NAD(P)/FAD-dependent oxidoreductase [Gammaproteobacteria bacterium]|nr:NAD(P)/FAD-dependent oxidoreductase [Gammaproteobacteria bacterium]